MSYEVFARNPKDEKPTRDFGRARVHVGGITIYKEAREYFTAERAVILFDAKTGKVGIKPDVAHDEWETSWIVRKTKYTHQIICRSFVCYLKDLGLVDHNGNSRSHDLRWNQAHGVLEFSPSMRLRRNMPSVAAPQPVTAGESPS